MGIGGALTSIGSSGAGIGVGSEVAVASWDSARSDRANPGAAKRMKQPIIRAAPRRSESRPLSSSSPNSATAIIAKVVARLPVKIASIQDNAPNESSEAVLEESWIAISAR